MPYDIPLENGLILRTVRDEKDIEKYVAFNSEFNNPNEGLNTNILLRYFPGSSFDDYQLIEDPKSGAIVATTCLIPWRMQMEGVPLRAGQLEQVLSHPAYRRHGLIKILIRRFMQTVVERGYDLSFIWGIPYYYRQYGYTYAIDGNAYESLPVARIPDRPSSQESNFRFRPARSIDANTLTRLYRAAMKSQTLHITRDQDHWRYLMEHACLPVYIVENRQTGHAVGYLGMVKSADGTVANIIESGITNQDAGWAALDFVKTQCSQEVQIAWPREGTLAGLARLLGSTPQVPSQWLFNFHHPEAFLLKLGPVLEKRLAESDCAGLTTDLIINLYRQAYRLCFHNGKLTGVDALGFIDSSMGADGGDLCIPPDAFVRLLLGYRDLDNLYDAWPDIVVKKRARHVLDALFPRHNSYLYATYAWFG